MLHHFIIQFVFEVNAVACTLYYYCMLISSYSTTCIAVPSITGQSWWIPPLLPPLFPVEGVPAGHSGGPCSLHTVEPLAAWFGNIPDDNYPPLSLYNKYFLILHNSFWPVIILHSDLFSRHVYFITRSMSCVMRGPSFLPRDEEARIPRVSLRAARGGGGVEGLNCGVPSKAARRVSAPWKLPRETEGWRSGGGGGGGGGRWGGGREGGQERRREQRERTVFYQPSAAWIVRSGRWGGKNPTLVSFSPTSPSLTCRPARVKRPGAWMVSAV